MNQTKDLLLVALGKDTTRLDIMQEVGKIYYYLRDYEKAYHYYKKFVSIRAAYHLNIYNSEDAKIGFVFNKMGHIEEGNKYLEKFKEYADNDQSIYKHSSLAIYYSYIGEKEKAIEQLRLFSKQNHYFYWSVLFMPLEPLMDNVTSLPEFKTTFGKIETKFNNWHKQIEKSLEAKDLI